MERRAKELVSILLIILLMLVNFKIDSFAVTIFSLPKSSLLLLDDEQSNGGEKIEEVLGEVEAEVETEVETEVEIEVETEVETEAETEVETEADAEIETETESKFEIELEAESKLKTESELEIDIATVAEIELINIIEDETNISSDSEIELEVKVSSISELQENIFTAPLGAYVLSNLWYDSSAAGMTYDLVTTITFASASDIPAVYDSSYSIAGGNGLEVYRSGTDITIYAPTNDTIYFHPDSYQMFYGFIALTHIYNLNVVDTSDATNMNSMFAYCNSLIDIDLSNFNTSNVEGIMQMFYDCWALDSLDLTSFDTSNLTDMYGTFGSCTNLASLDLTSFDTSNVTSMYQLFKNCPNLLTIKTSTDFVTTALNAGGDFEMFSGCTSLVGSNGTSYAIKYIDDPTKAIDRTYAQIDGYNGNPGYFDGVLPPAPPVPPTPPVPPAPPIPGGTSIYTGGNSSGPGTIIDRGLQFILETPIFETEYSWIYDSWGRREGISLSLDSLVAIALINSATTKELYSLSPDYKMIRLSGGGLYKIHYNGEECYFGFDKDGLLMTGFVEQTPRTRIINVNTDASIIATDSIETAKYYLYEGDEINRGKKWNRAVFVKGITYIFDTFGREISSFDLDNVQGMWEYNPFIDKWRFYIPDPDGRVHYYKDGMYNIIYNRVLCKYLFDVDGNLVVGYVTYQGKNYYAEETGTYLGAIREIA